MNTGTRIEGVPVAGSESVLSDEALLFVAGLHREFNGRRTELLARRAERQKLFDAGELPGFLLETADVRAGDWAVAPAPADLRKRWVEITGPVERKMMINALNSGASVFMADFEDSLSPTWENVVRGQVNLMDAVRRTIAYASPEGKSYRLNPSIATLLVRPRGWHLPEKHVLVDGAPVSASLFDFGLYLFHNAKALEERGTGPYFYLPKLESHLEARLWNDVFRAAQDALKIPRGTIRATVLIETLPAAFEMEEILYELREHASGLNAGRWDYLFSLIKKFHARADLVLPDRAQITMTVPFMRAYSELLVKTCHRRSAHAMGGMAPFIPTRKDPEINAAALAKVRADKDREAADGFDGTWVAHPDLVPVAWEVFEKALGEKPHQKERLREEVVPDPARLVDLRVPNGTVTEAGFRLNINVTLQYLNSWLLGNGAAAIFNLMEDAATAEISRAQLWQWLHRGAPLADGRRATAELYRTVRAEELARLGGSGSGRLGEAADLLDSLVLDQGFADFLTLPAYGLLA
ncbi:MAG: malate synthase A [Acidobacteriota bacterium]|nr:malate synthase A [Acidobacteriota bacterium]